MTLICMYMWGKTVVYVFVLMKASVHMGKFCEDGDNKAIII